MSCNIARQIIEKIVNESPDLILSKNPGHIHPKEFRNWNTEKQIRRIRRRDAKK